MTHPSEIDAVDGKAEQPLERIAAALERMAASLEVLTANQAEIADRLGSIIRPESMGGTIEREAAVRIFNVPL